MVEAVDIPVMGGEHEDTKWQMRDLKSIGNVDVVNADVIKCGGISECRKVAHLAEALGKRIMVHNARPTLATAASLQFVASIHNAARLQEYGGQRPELGLGEFFAEGLRYADGYLYLPQGPGLGLLPDEDRLEKAKRN